MAQVTLTVPDNQVDRIRTALVGLYPIPMITGDGEEAVPQFTENEWIKEKLRRWVIEQVLRYEQRQTIDTAKASIDNDNELAS